MATHCCGKTAQLVKQRETEYFNMLPDEILLIIFSHVGRKELTELGRVCRRFRRISHDKQFWKNVSLARKRVTARDFAYMITTYENIKNLDLSEGDLVPRFMPYVSQASSKTEKKPREKHFSKNLDTLNLSKCAFRKSKNNYHPNYEVGLCEMLKILKPKRLIANNARVFCEDTLRDAFSQSRQLEAVSLEYLGFCTLRHQRFKDIFLKCDNLRELNLSNSKLNELQLLNLCHLPSNVEKVMLNNVNLGKRYLDFFERFVIRAPNVKYLGVSLKYLTEPKVLAILNRHQNLESLRLYHDEWSKVRSLSKWTPGVYVDILKQLTNVRKIHFVMEKGVLGMIHKKRIPKQVAMLEYRLNADGLHIGIDFDIEFDIFQCDWELRFHKQCFR